MAIIGIAAGLAVLVIVVVLVLFCCFKKGRDVSLAPKGPPLVIMFSDIQDSTTLWAELEDRMDPMINQHHAIVRRLLRKYKGYEVKVRYGTSSPATGALLSPGFQGPGSPLPPLPCPPRPSPTRPPPQTFRSPFNVGIRRRTHPLSSLSLGDETGVCRHSERGTRAPQASEVHKGPQDPTKRVHDIPQTTTTTASGPKPAVVAPCNMVGPQLPRSWASSAPPYRSNRPLIDQGTGMPLRHVVNSTKSDVDRMQCRCCRTEAGAQRL